MGITAILINPYELGRQSFGLAHPAAVLREAGHTVRCIDFSVQQLSDELFQGAQLVAIQLAMHTATRIAIEALERIRMSAPGAHVCCYGLYAPVNEAYLRELGVDTILGGEFEPALAFLAQSLSTGTNAADDVSADILSNDAKVSFVVPYRDELTPLDQHAGLRLADGTEITMGFAETTRGCKHLCRHCPVVPVYKGRFRAIPADIVL
ncbi:MAG: radical SAM protein, partial [Chromatiales bacterium]|nr:radical SAM protein [Chromatiales bacterium]